MNSNNPYFQAGIMAAFNKISEFCEVEKYFSVPYYRIEDIEAAKTELIEKCREEETPVELPDGITVEDAYRLGDRDGFVRSDNRLVGLVKNIVENIEEVDREKIIKEVKDGFSGMFAQKGVITKEEFDAVIGGMLKGVMEKKYKEAIDEINNVNIASKNITIEEPQKDRENPR